MSRCHRRPLPVKSPAKRQEVANGHTRFHIASGWLVALVAMLVISHQTAIFAQDDSSSAADPQDAELSIVGEPEQTAADPFVDESGAVDNGNDAPARRTCKGDRCSRSDGACGLIAPCRFRGLGIDFGGWIDQGITFNGRRPADRFNGPVTFNDRDTEYQLNQFWLFARREANTGGYGWDIGGRVDLLYGTDSRFDTSLGLDDSWGDSSRFYGLVMPQLYMDFAVNDLTMRIGHFDTIIGYEVVQAPENFFYSHSYAMQYGEPFTHTGVLAIYEMSDRVTIKAGIDRGWDKWEDNNKDYSFLGGVGLSSCDEATTLDFAISSGAYDDAGLDNRTMYSLVLARKISRRLSYVIQHDWGMDDNGGVSLGGGAFENGEWYGVNQYLFYELNCDWQLGLRFEWFRDDDGTRVGGIGAPKGWALGPDIAADQIGWAGNFYEISLGLNWKPRSNIVVRPECRWDWYRGPVDGVGNLPYHAGSSLDQFTFATDLIITF
jgi:hypothetical protein